MCYNVDKSIGKILCEIIDKEKDLRELCYIVDDRPTKKENDNVTDSTKWFISYRGGSKGI